MIFTTSACKRIKWSMGYRVLFTDGFRFPMISSAFRMWTVYIGILHVYIIPDTALKVPRVWYMHARALLLGCLEENNFDQNPGGVDYKNLDNWRMPSSLRWPVLLNVSNQAWIIEISIHRPRQHGKRSRRLTLPLTERMAWMLEMTGVKLS